MSVLTAGAISESSIADDIVLYGAISAAGNNHSRAVQVDPNLTPE